MSSTNKVLPQDHAKGPRVGFDNGMNVIDLPASMHPDEVVADLVLSLRFTHPIVGCELCYALAEVRNLVADVSFAQIAVIPQRRGEWVKSTDCVL
jgi:hypothetical protein